MQLNPTVATSMKSTPTTFRQVALSGLVVLLAFATIAMTTASPARAQSGLGIAAVVNDEVISILDLDARISLSIALSRIENTQETRQRLAPQVLRTLIDEKLQRQEAKRLEIKISSSEVTRAIGFIENQNKMPPGEIEKIVASAGIPMSVFAQKTEVEIAWQTVVRNVLSPRIQVGADEISDVIEQIKANAGKPEYLLAELYLPVDRPEDEENVRKTAVRLLEQIKSGAPFQNLVRNFSGSPSAAIGGDMGWVPKEDLDPDLAKVIITLSPGQVTIPIRALGGYYIMLLRDTRKGEGLGDKTTLKLSQFHKTLDPNAKKSDHERVAGKLKKEASNLTTCTQFEAAAKKTGSQLSGSLGQIEVSVLPEDMRAVLEDLPLNRSSEPVKTGGGVAVLMICDRKTEEVDMEKVRQNINKRLIMQRLQISERRYLLDLRRAAFLDIRL